MKPGESNMSHLLRHRFHWLGVLCAWTLGVLAAQDLPRGFVNRVYKDETGDHKYVVFVPANYTPQTPAPVILFLHGAGECGTDGQLQTTIGLGPFVRQQAATFPFVVVFPQCEDTKGRILTRWRPDQPDGARALKILEDVEATYKTDPKRRSVVGWSMGGYGAWAQGAADPARWNAVMPLAGGGDPAEAAQLRATPVWVVHGVNDPAVKVEQSREMLTALKAAGGTPLYTEIPDGDHDCWRIAFSNPDVFRWLNNPHADDIDPAAPLLAKPGQKLELSPANSPFIPAVHVPRAVYLRLGNDMLAVLSDSVPKHVTSEMLTGRIGDLYDSTVAAGRTFGITFSGIYYSAQLNRASIKAYAPDRLNVQLGLQNLTLTISNTYVSGGNKSAVAGPISMVIGHQYPVWLSFDVKPYIDEQRKIRLQLIETRFSIPNDNYYVTNPAGVSTRGIGMTAERVTDGLVNGLYASKGRVENEVSAVVPSILKQLEERLAFTEIDHIVEGIWPIPVYQPRVQVWADEVSTDENGVSLVLGVTAAALTPQSAPKQPRRAEPAGLAATEVPRTTAFQIGLAPRLLTEMSQTIVDADVARIHVLDTPVKSLHTLTDPQVVAEMFPDLKRHGEHVQIWAELVLTQPLGISDSRALLASAESSATPDQKTASDKPPSAVPQLQFDVPGIVLSLAIKSDPTQKEWQPFAEIRYDIHQPTAPQVVSPTQITRAVRMNWDGSPLLTSTARFAPGYKPEVSDIQQGKLENLFRTVWQEWTQGKTAAEVVVPDIDFGYTKMRLQEVAWKSPQLTVRFDKPEVKLSNQSDRPLVYETKGPYSNWGQSLTLKPGATDTFKIAYPLLFRFTNAQGQLQYYTLPVGSVSEFRVPADGGPAAVLQAREVAAEPAATAP